eukprot:881748-Amphidinium_carterae.1
MKYFVAAAAVADAADGSCQDPKVLEFRHAHASKQCHCRSREARTSADLWRHATPSRNRTAASRCLFGFAPRTWPAGCPQPLQ